MATDIIKDALEELHSVLVVSRDAAKAMEMGFGVRDQNRIDEIETALSAYEALLKRVGELEGVRGTVTDEIVAERCRQIEKEGWAPDRDDLLHAKGEMAKAAGVYCFAAATDRADRYVMDQFGREGTPAGILSLWPWDPCWWKPTSRRRDLIKAAALIVAEIERLDRAALNKEGE